MIHQHSLYVTKNTSRYLNFAFGLSSKNIENIMNLKLFKIDNEDLILLNDFLPDVKLDIENKLPFEVLLDIRFTIINAMNMYENIALSYIQKVADSEIIELSMKEYLTKKDNNILSGCIKVAESYPTGDWVLILKNFQDNLREKLPNRESTA